MAVRVITDSGADISPKQAKELQIKVVPLYLRFGSEVYRDGVDIDSQEFYRRLESSAVHPTTSAPSPGDFAKAYRELAEETDEIISIHITRRHSGTYDAALAGKDVAKKEGCRIEVVDSKGVTMWQGLVTLVAAKAAQACLSLNEVLEVVHETIRRMHALALLDTLKYVVKGGRLGKTISAVESVLNVKLLLTLRNGELRPTGLVRTRSKGIARLQEFVKSIPHVSDLAIVYNTTPDEAQRLAQSISLLFPGIAPQVVRLGPALGVHAGPGALIAVVNTR